MEDQQTRLLSQAKRIIRLSNGMIEALAAAIEFRDALRSKRVYKPAFSREKALSMISNGECGSFNPRLL